jgi:hypothetical protein
MPMRWSPETEGNMDNLLQSLETSLDELNVAENIKPEVTVKCIHIKASREKF